MRYSLTILFLLVSLFTFNAAAKGLETDFAKANSLFEKGEYQKAQKAYDDLEKLGVHSTVLFYNRAVTEARLGNLGSAVQYFEKVLVKNPADESAVYNLKVIRNYIARRSNEQGRDADLAPFTSPWRATLDRFSEKSASISFIIFYILFFIVLFAAHFVKNEMLILSLRVSTGIFAAAAILLGAVTAGKKDQLTNQTEAIVTKVGDDYQLNVYDGPAENAKRFTLEEGARIKLLDTRNSWSKIMDDHGKDGWVKTENLGKI
ncbi:MAG: hypothetical protein JXR91_14515 [Deltaproteobacteria bacterium]|nr:hypothetical protein [Deltaproteobacteria bacterium]